MNMCTKRTSDLTEGEDRQRRLHPFGDLRVIPHVQHHLQVRQPVDHLQDEMFHAAAPEARRRHMYRAMMVSFNLKRNVLDWHEKEINLTQQWHHNRYRFFPHLAGNMQLRSLYSLCPMIW